MNINKRLQRQKDSLANYQLFNIIGRGAFGEVRLGRTLNTNQVVAIKRIQKRYLVNKRQIRNAYVERDFMMCSKSQFLVQIRSTFQDQSYLYIVMEYIQGGDLLHILIQKDILTQEETKFYIGQLVLAIEDIHEMEYIHRDIKPDNILIDRSGHIKISDFGLSKFLQIEKPACSEITYLSKMHKLRRLSNIKNKQRVFSKVGTPDYISPEVLTEKTYTHCVDLWSVGVIMFQCLYGFPPFADEDSKQVCHKVANWIDHLYFPEDVKISVEAKMLILGLITDKSKRLTISEIKNHAFFVGFNWKNIRKQKPPFIPQIKDELDSANFELFELVDGWTIEEKELTRANKIVEQRNQCQEQKILIKPKYNFPGFEYRKLQSNPLEEIRKQISLSKDLSRKSLTKMVCQLGKTINKNCLIGSDNQKRNKNMEKSSCSSMKGKRYKNRVEMTSPSEFLGSNNNTSLSRCPTQKQLLRINIQKQNKQNRSKYTFDKKEKVSSNKLDQQGRSCRKRKSTNKEKIEKLKQLYNSLNRSSWKSSQKENSANNKTIGY